MKYSPEIILTFRRFYFILASGRYNRPTFSGITMANTVKEIRVPFDDEKDQQAAYNLTVLSVIKGVDFDRMLADSMRLYIAQEGAALDEGTWVSQTELIDRLKTDYDITTNFQTLLNYRNDGKFDGIYCSDGQKKVFYLLEKVAAILNQPRTRRKPEKTAAMS